MYYIITKDCIVPKYTLKAGTKMYRKGDDLYDLNTNEWICDIGSPVYKEVVESATDSISDKKIKRVIFNNGINLYNVYIISIGGYETAVEEAKKEIIKFDSLKLLEFIQGLPATSTIGLGFSEKSYTTDDHAKIYGLKLNDIVDIVF